MLDELFYEWHRQTDFFIYIVSRPTFVTLISIQHDLGLHGKVNYKFIIL